MCNRPQNQNCHLRRLKGNRVTQTNTEAPARSYTKVIVTHQSERETVEPDVRWFVTDLPVATEIEDDGPMRFGNAYIWSSHYDRDLQSYMAMYAEALKDFPGLTMENCECLSVVQSGWAKGFAVLRFSVTPDLKMEGWENREDRLYDMILG